MALVLLECEPDPVLRELLPPTPSASMGPLKRLRLRLAKRTDGPGLLKGLGEPGGCGSREEPPPPPPLPLGIPSLKRVRGGPAPRTRRRLLGNEDVVGVAGRTLTEWWGDRPDGCGVLDMDVDTEPLELIDEALECEGRW